ncbi:MAG: hypothetical protein ACTS9Y_00385 [Methylophilus sp.]|uniref:hypothetical protein n=1 Tax=Methylophilus sp. TaxID=29541 RepID=UPI003FA032F0
MVNRIQLIVLAAMVAVLGDVYLGPLIQTKSEAKLIRVEDIYFECIQKKPEIILLDLNLNKLKDIKRLNKACNTKDEDLRGSRIVVAVTSPYKFDSWH